MMMWIALFLVFLGITSVIAFVFVFAPSHKLVAFTAMFAPIVVAAVALPMIIEWLGD